MKFNASNFVSKLFSQFFSGSTKAASTEVLHEERLMIYELLWSYYINNVYTREIYGGHFDYVNRLLGEAATNELYGLINPVEQVVELYAQNTFAGQWGKEFFIEDEVNDGRNKKKVNDAILEPINKIMKWSNFNLQKDRFARLTALFGNCGIRVVVRVGNDYPNDDVTKRRVYLQFEHPALIEDYMHDGRDNITQIMTKHRVQEGNLSFSATDKLEEHTYRLLMTREKFTTERDNQPANITGLNPQQQTEAEKEQVGTFADYGNVYGFVPYVLSFFRKHDSKWGAWSFMGSEITIDRNNSLSSHIEKQIFRHTNVTWMVTTTGDPPKEFNFGGNRVLLIKRQAQMEGINGDTTVEPLIANLDLSGALEKLKFNHTQLADKLPELKAIGGEFLSGQSGETIAQLRKPAEDKLIAFRGGAEASLSRAIQQALSVGVVLGIWDLGTGTGTREQADKAYQDGMMDFEFNTRPALTITRQEDLQLKQQEQDLENSKRDAGQDTDLFATAKQAAKDKALTDGKPRSQTQPNDDEVEETE